MLGIIVQLAISWAIVWFVEKKNLSVLGFKPSKQRLADFFLFLIITAVIAASGFFIRMQYGERWVENPPFNTLLLFKGLWWNIKSVLFEELIFRGVLFYILIKRLGSTKAIIISAVAFGMYHWFSYSVFGNPVPMLITFFITGIAGLLYTYAYVK
ncbi:MAG: CPBP family intramembrane metalloprotease, partial [Sphingobacteriales bacterium]